MWDELNVGFDDSFPAESKVLSGNLKPSKTLGIFTENTSIIHGHILKDGDIAQTSFKCHCAQPPYDLLPIPRGDIPAGIILSRDVESWIHEDQIEVADFTDSRGLPLLVKLGRGRKAIDLPVRGKAIAWPLYEGRMIGQFDFSDKGWVSGSGRSAVWRDIAWDRKQIEPQFLMSSKAYEIVSLKQYLDNIQEELGDEAFESELSRHVARGGHSEICLTPRLRIAFMDVTSATNERTMISSLAALAPHGNSAAILSTNRSPEALSGFLNSFVYDYVARARCSGLHLNWFIVEGTLKNSNFNKCSLVPDIVLQSGLRA